MIFIDKNNLEKLLLGSLFLATGGGFSPKEHRKIFERLLKAKNKLAIKRIEEFEAKDWLISVYGVGSSAKTKTEFKELIQKTLQSFKNYFRINVKGLIPGEIGGEGLAFESASYLNLPVVDSDLVGGRAAPEIQMDVFSIYGKPLTPMIAKSINKKEIIFTGNFNAKELEKILRNFFAQNKGVGVAAGYPIKARDYKKIGAKNTLSKAIKIGEILLSSTNPLNELLNFLKAKIIAKEKLKKVLLKNENGFLKGELVFSSKIIKVKNENMVCLEKKKIVDEAPSLIIILDAKTLTPIHNTEIKKFINKELIILSCPGEKYWYSKKGKKLFSYTE